MRPGRIWQAGLFELFDALRSSRAIVVTVLYLSVSTLGMASTASLLGSIERGYSAAVRRSSAESAEAGAVSKSLWQSDGLQSFAKRFAGESSSFDELRDRHPAELMYAWLTFLCVPLLTILMSASRIAQDVQSGAVRYMITRVTRFEWSLGKYMGNAVVMAGGLFVGMVAAWLVALLKLPGADAASLFAGMLGWCAKAWTLSLAWLGVALGVSHLVKGGAKATSLAVAAMLLVTILASWTSGAGGALSFLAWLFPGNMKGELWRTAPWHVAATSAWLLLLGLAYLVAGYACFARRDAR